MTESVSFMPSTNYGSPAARVARGAAYMDEKYPGWERMVDVSVLDIQDPSLCICGQVVSRILYGSHLGGYIAVSLELDEAYPEWQCAPAAFGFVDEANGDAWVALIKERFDSGTLSDG